jgi:hypothetical protein
MALRVTLFGFFAAAAAKNIARVGDGERFTN